MSLPEWWPFKDPYFIGDCLPYLKAIPDDSIDLIITDPPYNVGLDYGDTTNDKREDYKAWCKTWFNECLRISRGVVFTPGYTNLKMWITEIKYPKGIIIRAVPNQCSSSELGGFNMWEPILVYGKITCGKNLIIEMVKQQEDVGEHPCPKTTNMYEEIIKTVRPNPKILLDPFMGSGTILKASRNLNLTALGFEINPDYEPIIRKRSLQDIKPLEGYF